MLAGSHRSIERVAGCPIIKSAPESTRGKPIDTSAVQKAFQEALETIKRGAIQDGARHLERLLEENPGFADGWGHLGNVYHAIGEPQKAIHCYEKVCCLNPGDPGGLKALGDEYTGWLARLGKPTPPIGGCVDSGSTSRRRSRSAWPSPSPSRKNWSVDSGRQVSCLPCD